jgi:hypothetical protein
MKKWIAFLMCLTMVLSLFSCRTNDLKGEETVTSNDQKGEETITTDDQNGEEHVTTDDQNSEEHVTTDTAMHMREAAIKGEICVFDERLGEIGWKSLRFPSNDTSLDECKLLKKAIFDIDQDGINEYIIKSPDNEHIILRYYNGKVYSYCLDSCDYYKFNTDGTFYWAISPDSSTLECGLSRITFDGDSLNVRSLYSLKGPMQCEYFVDGEAVTAKEYHNYRDGFRTGAMDFSYLDLTPLYPINAEQAWNLANDYWDNQDGSRDYGVGNVWTNRIVLIDIPSSDTDYYRVSIQTLNELV